MAVYTVCDSWGLRLAPLTERIQWEWDRDPGYEAIDAMTTQIG